MSFLRNTGNFLGKTAGFVIGEPIKYVGQKIEIDLLKDIGEGVKSASTYAGDTVGQVASGSWDTVSGIINKDQVQRDKGLGDIGESIGRTGRGIVQTGKSVYHSGKDVYHGVKEGDEEQWKSGASNLIKVAAVATLAVGVVDFIDGADTVLADGADGADVASSSFDTSDAAYVDTINSGLAGTLHPETGVPYETKFIPMPDGEVVEGVFPDFNEAYSTQLPQDMYLYADEAHFRFSNQQLAYEISINPEMANQFTAEQLDQIRNGENPTGYSWHHSEEPGRMELVDEEIHANSGHTGGRELWGGGSDYR